MGPQRLRGFGSEVGLRERDKPLNGGLTNDHASETLRHPLSNSPRRIDKRLMRWTNERPKHAGVYWHRATPAASSHPVKIYSVGTLFYVWPIEEDGRADITVRLDDCSGEWAGPMGPPA